MHCSQATLEQGLRDSLYVDYRKKGSYFECTTVQAVKDICAKNSHCILDISIASLERLHRHQIYPIVLLIKFKSTKQIKEVKDPRYPSDKVSAKAAKEMYEQALKLEAEYRHFISGKFIFAPLLQSHYWQRLVNPGIIWVFLTLATTFFSKISSFKTFHLKEKKNATTIKIHTSRDAMKNCIFSGGLIAHLL